MPRPATKAETPAGARGVGISDPGSIWLLGAFFYLGHIEGTIRTLRGAPPPSPFRLLYLIGVALVIATWIRADRRRLGLASTFDDGFFIAVVWPLALPYHLFASRGWRGARALLGFVALYLATFVLALFSYLGVRSWSGDLR
jgi:hypothetical protein